MNRNSIFCDNKSNINDSESSLNRQIFNFVYHFELQAYYNIRSIFASCNSIFTLLSCVWNCIPQIKYLFLHLEMCSVLRCMFVFNL